MADLKPTIVPFLRYRDAPRAIEWLCEAFGFERIFVVPGEGGTIGHAQLRIGEGIVMLSSQHVPGSERISAEEGIYVVVPDADAHCARAKAAGADVFREPEDQDYGGRDYSVRDLEGHYWSFGTYQPGAE
jgi:uncharacterized glyoxalase superfamily protein PhnB